MAQAVTHNARRSQRLQHELAVTYRSVGRFLSDWATNISREGLFINTRNPLPVGTVVRLVIQLPGAAVPVDILGQVRRVAEWDAGVSRASGMGIEFTEPDRGKRDHIEAFVDKLRSDLGVS